MDGAQIRIYWRMSKRRGGVGGLKGTCTSLPISLSHIRTTCLTAERVCRMLGSVVGSILEMGFTLSGRDHLPHCSASVQGAWVCRVLGSAVESILGLGICFARKKYLQFKCNIIVKCVQELF